MGVGGVGGWEVGGEGVGGWGWGWGWGGRLVGGGGLGHEPLVADVGHLRRGQAQEGPGQVSTQRGSERMKNEEVLLKSAHKADRSRMQSKDAKLGMRRESAD